MTILAVGSSTFSCATTIVTTPAPLGLYVAWKMPIEGVYDAAAIAVTASANAAAHPKTVKRMDLFMAPSFVVSPACSCSDADSAGQLYREPRLCVGSLVQSRDGRAGDRPLPGKAGRQARPRRLQHGHLGRAAAAAGVALGSGRRCDPTRGARGRAGDPQP